MWVTGQVYAVAAPFEERVWHPYAAQLVERAKMMESMDMRAYEYWDGPDAASSDKDDRVLFERDSALVAQRYAKGPRRWHLLLADQLGDVMWTDLVATSGAIAERLELPADESKFMRTLVKAGWQADEGAIRSAQLPLIPSTLKRLFGDHHGFHHLGAGDVTLEYQYLYFPKAWPESVESFILRYESYDTTPPDRVHSDSIAQTLGQLSERLGLGEPLPVVADHALQRVLYAQSARALEERRKRAHLNLGWSRAVSYHTYER